LIDSITELSADGAEISKQISVQDLDL